MEWPKQIVRRRPHREKIPPPLGGWDVAVGLWYLVEVHRGEQADEPSDGRFDAEVSAEEHEKRHADVERQPEGAVERVARCGEDDVEQDVVVYDE